MICVICIVYNSNKQVREKSFKSPGAPEAHTLYSPPSLDYDFNNKTQKNLKLPFFKRLHPLPVMVPAKSRLYVLHVFKYIY